MKTLKLSSGMSRRTTMATVLATSAGLFLPVQNAQAQNRAERGIVGQFAPEPIAEFWIDGAGTATTFKLAQARGKWVHLKFWQSWCPGCHAHGFPALIKMVNAFAGEPRVVNVALQTVFEGFSSNSSDRVRHTQLRYRLPIVFGHDPGNSRDGRSGTMGRYRSGGTPWHVIVDPTGKVVFNDFGLDVDQAVRVIRADLQSR